MLPVITAKNLTKIYPGKSQFLAVDNISFDLQEGEILGLLGPNGSGKTTTIQMLLGTLTYTSGSIYYFGKDLVHHRSEILQDVSFASTYTSLPWLLTLEQNLDVFGYLYGFNSKESAKRYNPLLERFGILDKKKMRVSSLSAGQVTRLMLVKAFFIDPKIVLLDEPTASLDPDIAADICSFLLEQREKTCLSILFTSHKMQEVMTICDRTIFLKEGKIIANDLPEKLARSASAFKVKLLVIEGLEKTERIANESSFGYTVDHKTVEFLLDEEAIPILLNRLGQEGVLYANIKIDEPSLEDFFLQTIKSSHEPKL